MQMIPYTLIALYRGLACSLVHCLVLPLKDLKAQEKFQLQYNKKAAYLLNKVLNNNSTKINNNNERGPSHIFGKLYSLISDNTRESQYKK